MSGYTGYKDPEKLCCSQRVRLCYICDCFTAVTYTTEADSSRRKNEIVSVVLTTTSETEAGLELLVTVATPDTQQDLVIEGTFETGSYCCCGEISCNWTWLIQGPTANCFVTVQLSKENGCFHLCMVTVRRKLTFSFTFMGNVIWIFQVLSDV